MSVYVFDTDVFSLYQNGHPAVIRNIVRHVGHRLAVTVTTADELVSGWQTRLRRARTDPDIALAERRLAEVLELMAGWEVLPMTVPALARYDGLRQAKFNVKSPDLRIAAVAMEVGGIVVTRNLRDFRRVPGLTCEDWSV
jgi:tRNA(fMet)-specific endonuclease VapC